MAAQQTPGSGSGPDPAQEDQRRTSSWDVLKDLRLSIVDGGVNALKQGMLRITGAFKTEPSAPEPTAHRTVPEAEVGPVVETAAVPVEPSAPAASPSAARPSEQIRVADAWINSLMDNLMSSVEPVGEEDNEGARDSAGAFHIQHNEHQQITRINYPSGAWTTISYDGNDPFQTRLVARDDGLEWRHEGARWYQYKHGKITGETISGAFDIRSDGEVVIIDAAGDEIERWVPDGTIVESTANGPDVIKDSAGSTKTLRFNARNDKQPSTYEYANGQLMAARTGDGQLWARVADGQWQRPGGLTQSLELSVSRHGDCVITKHGEVVAIKHRDGSKTEFKYTGDREIRKNGQVIEVVNSDGSTHLFSPRASASEQADDAPLSRYYPAPGL